MEHINCNLSETFYYISIEPVFTLSPSVIAAYGNVVNFTCQTYGTTQLLVWFVGPGPVTTNNDMTSVYTTNTSNGILSVLTIRAVPIVAYNDIINIACEFSLFQVKVATLTIRGTLSLYNIIN